MRIRYVLILFLLFSYCVGPAETAHSQQTVPESGRKVVRKMPPLYPDIARKMNLVGTVRVVASVSADGGVKSVEPVGGSPVLIKAAEEAVVKWKFAPGGESKEVVEFHFNP